MDASFNYSQESLVKLSEEVRELKSIIKSLYQQLAAPASPPQKRSYKDTDAKKENALQVGRRMLILAPGAEGIPSVRELAKEMGVSTASLYKKKTRKGDDNPYHSIIVHRNMLIESYSYQSSSVSLREGMSDIGETASGDKHRTVDGVHYDDEIEE